LLCERAPSKEPVVVRLEPAAAATLTFLDAFDVPVPGVTPSIQLCLPSGRKADSKLETSELASRRWLPLEVDATGPDGKINLNGLVPGGQYRIYVGRNGKVGQSSLTARRGARQNVKIVVSDSMDD
jgi:hypothetical protein